MLDTYTRTNYTNEQANAVATIMKDCGGSVSMQYTSSGSGAYASDACLALRKNFQYSQATKLYTRYFLPKNDWMDIIYRELNDSCPILYGGTTTDGAGHEFVFDGYDKNGLVHVNWGWDGTNNGYFDVALLNSSEGNFTENQNMVIVRHPDDNRRDATYHSLWGTDTGLNITLAGSKAKISNFTIYNIDVENFTGYVQLVAKNTSTGYVTPLTDFALIENMEYGYGNKYSYEADLSELENGQYLVYAGSSSTASGKEELDWQPVTGNENITTSYLLTVDQGKFTLVKTNENISTGIANAPTKEEKANETQVYNMQGQLVMQSATSNIDINRLPTHATFIVRQGAKTVKIIR